MAVQKCPVCNGRGTVLAGFYEDNACLSTKRVPCRACGGKGVIITPEPSIYPRPIPDTPSIYPPWEPLPRRPYPWLDSHDNPWWACENDGSGPWESGVIRAF